MLQFDEVTLGLGIIVGGTLVGMFVLAYIIIKQQSELGKLRKQ